MKWQNIYEIVYDLEEKYPNLDILGVSFPKLHSMVTKLENFEDNPNKSNEKILEAIQSAWIEERS